MVDDTRDSMTRNGEKRLLYAYGTSLIGIHGIELGRLSYVGLLRHDVLRHDVGISVHRVILSIMSSRILRMHHQSAADDHLEVGIAGSNRN